MRVWLLVVISVVSLNYGCNSAKIDTSKSDSVIIAEVVACKKLWIDLVNQGKIYKLNNAELEFEWRKNKDKCYKSGVFDFQLSNLLFLQGKASEAGELIKRRLITYKGPLSFELEMKNISYNRAVPLEIDKSRTKKEWEDIYISYADLIKKYNKNHREIQHGMSLASYRNNNFKNAKKHALESLRFQASIPSFSILIKSSVLLGEHKSAVHHYNQALKHSQAILKDPVLIMFAARAHAMTGETEMANKMQSFISKVKFGKKAKKYINETNKIINSKI